MNCLKKSRFYFNIKCYQILLSNLTKVQTNITKFYYQILSRYKPILPNFIIKSYQGANQYYQILLSNFIKVQTNITKFYYQILPRCKLILPNSIIKSYQGANQYYQILLSNLTKVQTPDVDARRSCKLLLIGSQNLQRNCPP